MHHKQHPTNLMSTAISVATPASKQTELLAGAHQLPAIVAYPTQILTLKFKFATVLQGEQ